MQVRRTSFKMQQQNNITVATHEISNQMIIYDIMTARCMASPAKSLCLSYAPPFVEERRVSAMVKVYASLLSRSVASVQLSKR